MMNLSLIKIVLFVHSLHRHHPTDHRGASQPSMQADDRPAGMPSPNRPNKYIQWWAFKHNFYLLLTKIFTRDVYLIYANILKRIWFKSYFWSHPSHSIKSPLTLLLINSFHPTDRCPITSRRRPGSYEKVRTKPNALESLKVLSWCLILIYFEILTHSQDKWYRNFNWFT